MKRLYDSLVDWGLEEDTINRIIPLFQTETFDKGELFSRPGEKIYRIGFLMSGQFYEYIIDDKDKVFIHEFYGPGTFLTCRFQWGKTSGTFMESLGKTEVLAAPLHFLKKELGDKTLRRQQC